jgi:hypothetical protein
MALYWLHHVKGLQELGYDVHYLERLDRPGDAYDPETGSMSDDPGYAVRYLAQLLPRFGIHPGEASFIDLAGTCHLSGRHALDVALGRASFVLNVGIPTWFDELERCERRLYIDCDPVFTQVAVVTGEGTRANPPLHYDTLFTYGARIGRDDCLIPTGGREWIPARTVVATSLWNVQPTPANAPVVALMHWAAGSDLEFDGNVFGHKDREFSRFVDLPRGRSERFVLAVGGRRAPRAELERTGWELADPLAATGTIDDYRQFIDKSLVDLGIAKHAYVSSRSGWFSDRSTCYLAAGRPVLHQDTGFRDWLPVEEGVLTFSDMDSLGEALDSLGRDYARHASAARRVAEEHFEARDVLAKMLEQAGVR